MVKTSVLDLNDPKKRNRWIIGTPPQVTKSSPFYSNQIQIAHVKNHNTKASLEKEEEHSHTPPIEEYYFVLQGTLKIKADTTLINLKPMQILPIPPNIRHRVLDCSLPSEYLVIRAPISNEKNKNQNLSEINPTKP